MGKLIDIGIKEKEYNVKQGLEFLKALTQLDVIEVFGVARLLNVEIAAKPENEEIISHDNINTRDAGDILSDIIDAFVKLERGPRKTLLKIVKKGAKEDKKSGRK